MSFSLYRASPEAELLVSRARVISSFIAYRQASKPGTTALRARPLAALTTLSRTDSDAQKHARMALPGRSARRIFSARPACGSSCRLRWRQVDFRSRHTAQRSSRFKLALPTHGRLFARKASSQQASLSAKPTSTCAASVFMKIPSAPNQKHGRD